MEKFMEKHPACFATLCGAALLTGLGIAAIAPIAICITIGSVWPALLYFPIVGGAAGFMCYLDD